MAKHVLFIQGAGEGAYQEDKKLADNLRQTLGADYDVRYSLMPDEDTAPWFFGSCRDRAEIEGGAPRRLMGRHG